MRRARSGGHRYCKKVDDEVCVAALMALASMRFGLDYARYRNITGIFCQLGQKQETFYSKLDKFESLSRNKIG